MLTGNQINEKVKERFEQMGIICWRNNQFSRKDRPFRGRKGVSDVIGFTGKPVIMFGKQFMMGVFVACEGKSLTDDLSDDQLDFLYDVKSAGGIACIAMADSSDRINYVEYSPEKFPKKVKKS